MDNTVVNSASTSSGNTNVASKMGILSGHGWFDSYQLYFHQKPEWSRFRLVCPVCIVEDS